MPGTYLAALLLSTAGVLAIDVRHRLALPLAPVRTIVVVIAGTAFLLGWDLAGIATGVFREGASPSLLGVDLAPGLPVEEPVFLAFLCYLALVTWRGADVLLRRRAHRADPR